jgi:hypothetical protein
MAYELVQTIIPYKQVFRYPSPKRKLWSNWFGESVDLRIEVVDPEEAPVAYEVRFGPDDAPGLLGYQIRSYQGGLWCRWAATSTTSCTQSPSRRR